MYAVIRSGGKQYRVAPGQTIRLEKVAGEVGAKIELGNILLVENDGNVQVGSPLVANAKIQATVVEHDRAKKILVFKKKRKKQYRRTQGHRQDYTAVRIDSIIASEKSGRIKTKSAVHVMAGTAIRSGSE